MHDLLLNYLDSTSIYFEIFLEKAEVFLGVPYEEINLDDPTKRNSFFEESKIIW